MTHLTEELRHTVSAEWFSSGASVAGTGGSTRLRYYQALRTHLERLEAAGASWREAPIGRAELAALAGARASSTLYSLFGPASRSLIAGYANGPYVAGRHPGPVEALISEARADSFWPYREAWAQTLKALGREDPRFAAETLIRVLAEWAVADRRMATVRHCEPPVCAVEDLRLICPGTPPVVAVVALLNRVVELAQSPRGLSPLGILNAVHDQLMTLGFDRAAPLDELLGELTEALAAVEYLVPSLSRDDRETLAIQVGPQLRAVLRLLEEQT